MYQLVLIIHILVAFCLILLVLVQQGKGATIGAAFGSGASQTVFGSRGSGSFLLKITIGFAIVFFLTGLALNRMVMSAAQQAKQVQLPLPVQQLPADSTNNIPTIPKENK